MSALHSVAGCLQVPAWYVLTQHNTTQHNNTTQQHNTTQHNTTQHNTTQHNTTQHNTTLTCICSLQCLGHKEECEKEKLALVQRKRLLQEEKDVANHKAAEIKKQRKELKKKAGLAAAPSELVQLTTGLLAAGTPLALQSALNVARNHKSANTPVTLQSLMAAMKPDELKKLTNAITAASNDDANLASGKPSAAKKQKTVS